MKISRKELKLAWATAAVLIVGGSYLWLEPRLTALSANTAQRQEQTDNAQRFQMKIDRIPSLEVRVAEHWASLPSYDANDRGVSKFLSMLGDTAKNSQLILLSSQPDEPVEVGDLTEVSIKCSWEGTLDSLAHFLYAIQQEGAMLDISQLRVLPKPGDPVRLKGNFTVDFAFSRKAVDEPAPAAS